MTTMTFTRGMDPKVAMGIGKKITNVEKRDYIKNKMATNKTWAIQGLLKIFEFQTETEKIQEETNCNNSVGFTGADAEILTSFAKQYIRRGFLSEKQMIYIYKKMPKYWMQIIKISDEQKLASLIKTQYMN